MSSCKKNYMNIAATTATMTTKLATVAEVAESITGPVLEGTVAPVVPAFAGTDEVSEVMSSTATLVTPLVFIALFNTVVNAVLSENVAAIFTDIVFIASSDMTLTSYETLNMIRGQRKERGKNRALKLETPTQYTQAAPSKNIYHVPATFSLQ